jgi:hypothetical protein
MFNTILHSSNTTDHESKVSNRIFGSFSFEFAFDLRMSTGTNAGVAGAIDNDHYKIQNFKRVSETGLATYIKFSISECK